MLLVTVADGECLGPLCSYGCQVRPSEDPCHHQTLFFPPNFTQDASAAVWLKTFHFLKKKRRRIYELVGDLKGFSEGA